MSCPGSRDRLPGCWCCGQLAGGADSHSVGGRVRGEPPNQVKGRLRRESGIGPPPIEVGGRLWVVACVKWGQVPQARSAAGRPFKQGRPKLRRMAKGAEGSAPSSKEWAGEAGVRTPTQRPTVQGAGKSSPRAGGPADCAPRRACRAASASPGPPPPPASRRAREQGRRPVPRPGCRPSGY